MRVALITTTIHVPLVLELYREIYPHVDFFITGDEKTPHEEAKRFISGLGYANYYSVEDQKRLGYKCSELIGWNKIMRRNIALLEAIKSKADVIITVDDDNIPLGFDSFCPLFNSTFSGLQVDTERHWFDVGELLEPQVHHRGFPYEYRSEKAVMAPIVNAPVGIAAGLWLGDPDIDAMARITNSPQVYHLSDVLQSGIVVAKTCRTVFNSQNTAFVRELAPAMMVLCGVGRYDDIWASLIAQRIMRDTPWHVHFGKPFVWQERNSQNLWTNLQDEIYGMKHTKKFAEDLDNITVGGHPLEKLRHIYTKLDPTETSFNYLPKNFCELGLAWCDDIERIL